MESQTQKMSTITGFSSSGSRWSGIPCQKWSRKFWIWNRTFEELCHFEWMVHCFAGFALICCIRRIIKCSHVTVVITSSKLTLMALSRMHWQCVLYIMIRVSTCKRTMKEKKDKETSYSPLNNYCQCNIVNSKHTFL